jgi:hypothetical protein
MRPLLSTLILSVVAAVPAAAASIALDWPDSPASDVAQYRIYRAVGGSVGVSEANLIATVSASQWRDTRVVGGRRYAYVVTAVDRGGLASAPSPVASAVASDEREVRLLVVDAPATPLLDATPSAPTWIDATGAAVFADLDPAATYQWTFVAVDGDG